MIALFQCDSCHAIDEQTSDGQRYCKACLERQRKDRRMIELHLPFPPSANSIWRKSGTRIHKSAGYADWLREAGWQVISQKAGAIKGPYKLSINAVRPDKRRRDLDNLAKSVSDLLKSVGVIEDDHLAEMISLRWVTAGDGVTVRVEQAGVE